MNKIFIKFISFALAVTFLFCCIFVLFSVKNDFALAEDLTAYNYLVNFLENCPEREAGSESPYGAGIKDATSKIGMHRSKALAHRVAAERVNHME